MDVFVIPIGADRYELLSEDRSRSGEESEPPVRGLFGALRHRFGTMLRLAEEREYGSGEAWPEPPGWWGRMQERLVGWVAERIAEQRLLWNLRGESAVVAVHPREMSFDQVMVLVRRILQRDYERHRLWLAIDAVGLVASGLLALLPGPNLVAYYFAFRVVGHWLSMRGATQGLRQVTWSGRPSSALTELREVGAMLPDERAARVEQIAAELQLRKLSKFLDRVAAPSA